MISLPLEQINREAPYNIKGLKDGSVFFTTDNGLHYIVSFDPDDVSLTHLCYQLVIVNVDNMPSPRDIKLRDTIVAIVEGFFASNNEVMLYICETGDGKQAMRNRLFQYWYSHYERKQEFTHLILVNKISRQAAKGAKDRIRTDPWRKLCVLCGFARNTFSPFERT